MNISLFSPRKDTKLNNNSEFLFTFDAYRTLKDYNMRHYATILSVLLMFPLLCSAETAGSEATVKFSAQEIIQTNNAQWEGWGTSLCWWANRIGYNKTLTDKAASLFFNKENGLGLNIMRYNIGGGDDPEHHHIARTDSDIPGWLVYDVSTGEYSYDYQADSCQLNVLRASAKAAGQDAYIEVFSNSPPYFLTNSGCSSGNFRAEVNNLRDDSYQAFAEYLANVADYIQTNMGLDVRSLAPMNEPNTNYWGAGSNKQEGCHFDAGDAQSRILTLTSAALARHGLDDIILTASDETNPGKQLEELKTFTPEARKAIGRISAHTYGVNQIRELGQEARNQGINIWMSEVDGNGTSGQDAGQMSAALWLADKIIFDISQLEPSAWVLWQVIDTHVSQNGYKGRTDKGPLNLSGGFWGTAYANHDTNQICLSQKYYAFGQFSRYIRPGASLIKCRTGVRGCNAIAAIDGKHHQFVIVCTNTTAQPHDISFDMSDFNIRSPKATAYRTSGSIEDGEHWSNTGKYKVRKGLLDATLAPNSVTTYVIRY